jgi:hypothetical protein
VMGDHNSIFIYAKGGSYDEAIHVREAIGNERYIS